MVSNNLVVAARLRLLWRAREQRPRARSVHSPVLRLEPAEPLVDQREPLSVELVDARTAGSLVLQQAGIFEHEEVPGRGGPRVLEAGRQLAGRCGASSKMKREQDLSTRGVRDGVQHLVEGGELRDRRQRRWRRQTGSTSQIVSSSRTGPMGSHTDITSGV